MRFLEIINKKKFTLISVLMLIYVILNLLDGERGLISYYEKQKMIKELIKEKNIVTLKLDLIEKKKQYINRSYRY